MGALYTTTRQHTTPSPKDLHKDAVISQLPVLAPLSHRHYHHAHGIVRVSNAFLALNLFYRLLREITRAEVGFRVRMRVTAMSAFLRKNGKDDNS